MRTSNAVDPATRTLLAEVDVRQSSGELLPGSYTEVHLHTSSAAPALIVPVSALILEPDGLHVATVDANNIAHIVRVSAGRDFGTTVEILGGLQPGQGVIANPPDSLTDGEKVRVVTPNQQSGERNNEERKAIRTAGALLAVLAIGGCKVGPNYRAPTMPAPPAYSDNGHNGDWAAASPADAANRGDWWAIYQDAELNDLEQRCATANQNIAAALHAYEQAHDLVRENESSLYPTVSIGASATRNRYLRTKPLHTSGLPTNYWDFLIPLNISWEPDLWGGIRRQIESSAATAQATAADLANTRLSLQGMLAVTFFQLRGLDLQAQLLRSTIDSYKQTLQLTQYRLKGGLASESDVEQAQAQLEQTRAQLIDLGVQRAQYEHAIAVLVGEPATDFHIADKAVDWRSAQRAHWHSVGVAGAPSGHRGRGAASRVSERADRRCEVCILSQHRTGCERRSRKRSDRPAFQRGQRYMERRADCERDPLRCGRRKAQVDYAVAQREQATALYRQQVLSAFRDVEDQLSALRVLEEEATVTGRAVDSAKRSTELSTLRYKRGLAPYLEVLTNQTMELANERTAASLVTQRIVASAQLQMALGRRMEFNATSEQLVEVATCRLCSCIQQSLIYPHHLRETRSVIVSNILRDI